MSYVPFFRFVKFRYLVTPILCFISFILLMLLCLIKHVHVIVRYIDEHECDFGRAHVTLAIAFLQLRPCLLGLSIGCLFPEKLLLYIRYWMSHRQPDVSLPLIWL